MLAQDSDSSSLDAFYRINTLYRRKPLTLNTIAKPTMTNIYTGNSWETELTFHRANWMGELSSRFRKARTLASMTFIGSHIPLNSQYQSLTLQDQLRSGSRFFEFSLSYNKGSKTYVDVHSSKPFLNILLDFIDYLKYHRDEIVIINLKLVADVKSRVVSQASLESVIQLVEMNAGSLLIDPETGIRQSLEWYSRHRKRLLVSIQGEASKLDYTSNSVAFNPRITKSTPQAATRFSFRTIRKWPYDKVWHTPQGFSLSAVAVSTPDELLKVAVNRMLPNILGYGNHKRFFAPVLKWHSRRAEKKNIRMTPALSRLASLMLPPRVSGNIPKVTENRKLVTKCSKLRSRHIKKKNLIPVLGNFILVDFVQDVNNSVFVDIVTRSSSRVRQPELELGHLYE